MNITSRRSPTLLKSKNCFKASLQREQCSHVFSVQPVKAQLFAMFVRTFTLSSVIVCTRNMKMRYTQKQCAQIDEHYKNCFKASLQMLHLQIDQ